MAHLNRLLLTVFHPPIPEPDSSDDSKYEEVGMAYEAGYIANPYSGRCSVQRNVREGWQQLWGDYFCPFLVYNSSLFRRRSTYCISYQCRIPLHMQLTMTISRKGQMLPANWDAILTKR
ncbi:hypothetical protein BAE44_0010763 [Dichanthelium oligosanthes]|uniref:Uncharacterized protein n=1 Tax=Dichanthelium oligosanthes TaxID=888268 RepID=A0A1E5VSX3_9POAL|nr:hypothetical protein BAE44_0010763 [Dichanthelium oligosanthes]